MEHVIFALYILVFSTGCAGSVAFAVLYYRTRLAPVIFYALTHAALLLALGLVALYFYAGSVLGLDTDASRLFSLVIPLALLVLNILIYIGLYLAVSKRPDGSGSLRLLKRVFGILTGILVCLMCAEALLHIAGMRESSPIFGGIISVTVYVLVAAVLLLCAYLSGSVGSSSEPRSFRFLLRGFSLCLYAFVPLTIAEYALNTATTVPWKPLSLEYLVFLAINCIAIISAGISLVENLPASSAPLAVSGEIVARFGLTPREIEMVMMIQRGMTNKEIAWELNISPATVRTHIYNLFQKVSVQSRIALLNAVFRE